jgi:hypothetical protein
MNINELRIGNYIYFNNKEIGIITGIVKTPLSTKVFLNHRIDISYNLSDISPLPLIEERLDKLGFFRHGYDLYEIHHPDYIRFNLVADHSINTDEDIIINKECIGWNYNRSDDFINSNTTDSIVEIRYVHEIQNLYYDLHKEMLTL